MTSRLPYPQDHASHIPFLVGIGREFTIRSVVEFGSGIYSTPLFLNTEAFPKVDMVLSSETDQEWRKKVFDACGPDKRLTINEKEPDILVLPFVDLVFVDNGPEQNKINTIRWMAEAAEATIVVVHDAEVPNYLREIQKFKAVQISNIYNPGTAICTNMAGPDFLEKTINIVRKIESINYQIPVNDIPRWIEVFRG